MKADVSYWILGFLIVALLVGGLFLLRPTWLAGDSAVTISGDEEGILAPMPRPEGGRANARTPSSVEPVRIVGFAEVSAAEPPLIKFRVIDQDGRPAPQAIVNVVVLTEESERTPTSSPASERFDDDFAHLMVWPTTEDFTGDAIPLDATATGWIPASPFGRVVRAVTSEGVATIRVDSAKVESFELTLADDLLGSVIVRDDSGAPASDVDVILRSDDDRNALVVWRGTTNQEGRVTLRRRDQMFFPWIDVPDYRVTLDGPLEGVVGRQPIVDPYTPVEFRLPARGSLRVTVKPPCDWPLMVTVIAPLKIPPVIATNASESLRGDSAVDLHEIEIEEEGCVEEIEFFENGSAPITQWSMPAEAYAALNDVPEGWHQRKPTRDGSVTFRNLPAKERVVVCVDDPRSVYVCRVVDASVSVTSVTEIEVTLVPIDPPPVTGRALFEGGRPLANQTIWTCAGSFRTDADGRFRTYLAADDFVSEEPEVRLLHVDPGIGYSRRHCSARLSLGSSTRDVGDVVFRPWPVALAGRVVDEEGHGIFGVEITLSVEEEPDSEFDLPWLDFDPACYSAADGSYSIQAPTELSSFIVEAGHRNYLASPDETTHRELLSERRDDYLIRLQREGLVAGRVICDQDVPPSVIVVVSDDGGAVAPETDGTFMLTGLLGDRSIRLILFDGRADHEITTERDRGPEVLWASGSLKVKGGETLTLPEIDLRGRIHRYEVMGRDTAGGQVSDFSIRFIGREFRSPNIYEAQSGGSVFYSIDRAFDVVVRSGGYAAERRTLAPGDHTFTLAPAPRFRFKGSQESMPVARAIYLRLFVESGDSESRLDDVACADACRPEWRSSLNFVDAPGAYRLKVVACWVDRDWNFKAIELPRRRVLNVEAGIENVFELRFDEADVAAIRRTLGE